MVEKVCLDTKNNQRKKLFLVAQMKDVYYDLMKCTKYILPAVLRTTGVHMYIL